MNTRASNAEPLPNILGLQKELTETQTLLAEKESASDEMMEAMQILSEEIKIWVHRCRQVVNVLQMVEVERDNFRAGEGVAKEQGRGIKVKLEDTGSGDYSPPDVAFELADTKAQLADARDDLSNTKNDLANTKNDLADAKRKQQASEAALSKATKQLADAAKESTNKSEESIRANDILRSKLESSDTEREAAQRALADSQNVIVVIAEIKARLVDTMDTLLTTALSGEPIAALTDSSSTPAASSMLSLGDPPSKTAATINWSEMLERLERFERFEFTRQLEDRQQRYTEALNGLCDFVLRHIRLVSEGVHNAKNSVVSPLVTPSDKTLDELNKMFKEFYYCSYGWTGGLMLDTREAEAEELWRIGSFEVHRSRCIAKADVELQKLQWILRSWSGYGPRVIVIDWQGSARRTCQLCFDKRIIPSRSDQDALPATWARWERLWAGANGSPTSLPDYCFIRSTRYGQRPEALLVIYSWSFYKIIDTDWVGEYISELLRALSHILKSCGDSLRLRLINEEPISDSEDEEQEKSVAGTSMVGNDKDATNERSAASEITPLRIFCKSSIKS